MLSLQQVQNLSYHEIHYVIDGLRVGIETGHRRDDHCAGQCRFSHIFNMDQAQRRLSGDDDAFSSFF